MFLQLQAMQEARQQMNNLAGQSALSGISKTAELTSVAKESPKAHGRSNSVPRTDPNRPKAGELAQVLGQIVTELSIQQQRSASTGRSARRLEQAQQVKQDVGQLLGKLQLAQQRGGAHGLRCACQLGSVWILLRMLTISASFCVVCRQ